MFTPQQKITFNNVTLNWSRLTRYFIETILWQIPMVLTKSEKKRFKNISVLSYNINFSIQMRNPRICHQL